MSFKERWVSDCGRVTLYQGDCLDILPTLAPCDAVVTDPPYGVALKVKRFKNSSSGKIKERAAVYNINPDDTPEYVRNVVVKSLGILRKMAKAVVLTPGTRNLWEYPPADGMGCVFSASGTGITKWGFTCMHPVLYYGKCPYMSNSLGGRPNSFQQCYGNDSIKQDHPCAKPIKTMLWLVQRASLDGNTVLDPYMGSGTTGVACLRTGRRFIGIEIDEGYYATAKKRIQAELASHAKMLEFNAGAIAGHVYAGRFFDAGKRNSSRSTHGERNHWRGVCPDWSPLYMNRD